MSDKKPKPLRIRKKGMSYRKPNPNLADDDPCWCGSGEPFAQCHKKWGLVRDRKMRQYVCWPGSKDPDKP